MQIYRVFPWFFHFYVWWQWRVVILCNSIDGVDKTGAGACHLMPQKKQLKLAGRHQLHDPHGIYWLSECLLVAVLPFRPLGLPKFLKMVKRSSHAISFPKCLPQLPWPGNFVPHRPQRTALHVRTDPIAVLAAPEKESWPALKTGELTKT